MAASVVLSKPRLDLVRRALLTDVATPRIATTDAGELTSISSTRILRVLKALRGHALNGVSNGELASALGESPANINRALNTLIEEGLALKLDNGRFAPGVQLLQIAMAHSNEMARAQDRINEINQRVMAGSR